MIAANALRAGFVQNARGLEDRREHKVSSTDLLQLRRCEANENAMQR